MLSKIRWEIQQFLVRRHHVRSETDTSKCCQIYDAAISLADQSPSWAQDIDISNSDSLQRHTIKHATATEPNPSGRSKRACLTCRTGKVKCNGNEICSRCIKKGINCQYEKNVISLGDETSSWDETMDVPSPQTLDIDISGLPVHPFSTGKILNSATITRPLVPETE